MVRVDDCLRAAIATATQVPISRVPDLELDKHYRCGTPEKLISLISWHAIEAWAKTQGLVLTYHDEVPAPRARWIGVVPASSWTPMPFADHCLVMEDERLLFDPARDARRFLSGLLPRAWTPDQVSWGISFDPKEK